MLKCSSFVRMQVRFVAVVLIVALFSWESPVNAAPVSERRSCSKAQLGDVDGNERVTIKDTELIALYAVGRIDTLPCLEKADVTEDSKITVEDAMIVTQRLKGHSRVVVAAPAYGLPSNTYVGTLVRVEVFEQYFPLHLTGGIVKIKSPSTRYDSGDQPLTFGHDRQSLYYHWDTGGLPPASDYEIFVTLTKSQALQADQRIQSRASPQTPRQPEIVLALTPRPFEVVHLARMWDAFAPAPGIPLEFRRVFPQDSANAPYLGPLGRGWMHNFDVRLDEFTDGRTAFLGPDGFNRWFKGNANGTYTASPGDYGVLARDPDGTFQLKEKNGFIYRFRSDLLLDYMQDPNGNRATAIYNVDNQLIEVRHSNSQSFRLEYNAQGRISKLIDHVGRETIYTYDNSGTHLLGVTAPGNRVTSYTYSLGQSIASDHRLLSIKFPDGTHLNYSYDPEGRLASQEGDGGTGRLVWAYEPDGTARITDAVGGTTTIKANEQRQPTEVINPLGALTRYTYDANFNLIEVTDSLGRTSLLTYDSRGNIIRSTDPLRGTMRFNYEPKFNRITKIRDSLGRTTSFSYDTRGNLTAITYPGGSRERFTYDQDGSLRSKTNRDGKVITYAHNPRGLLLSKAYPDGSGVAYTYDSPGNLTSAANDTGTIDFEYDTIDRLVRTTYPGDRSFLYEYNAAGKRTRMINPDGMVLNYQYDTAGRLAAVTDGNGQTIVAYQYDAANRRMRKILGNEAYTSYEYDAAGQILRLINYNPTEDIISYFYYTYDTAGNPLSKETIEGLEKYTYDALDQLTNVTYPDGTTTRFVYDSMGNRRRVVENGRTTPYSVNRLNQYTATGPTRYRYDANGNLISKTEGGQTTYYDYDVENRLIRVRTPTETIAYTYDPFGLRNTRSDAQGIIRYLRDGDQVAIEEGDAHETVTSYVWGGILDEATRMEQGRALYYYAQDGMLSVSDLVDASGNPAEHYRYRVFGEPLVESSLGNPWLFTGRPYDSRTGLQYNRYRYYSPNIGRFITVDPVGTTGGINAYSYAVNAPASYSDPLGLWLVDIDAVFISIWFGHDPKTGVSGFGVGVGPGAGFYFTKESAPTAGVTVAATGAIIRGGSYGGTFFPNWHWMAYQQGSKYGVWGLGLGLTLGVTFTWGGGVCPTFVQPPPYVEIAALHTTHLDVSQEQLAGKMTVPVEGALLRSDIPIFGVAGGKEFKEYRIEYGEGMNPPEWHLIESSTTPQPTTDVGLAEMRLMQGDINIRGNLATWNTGLKNWVHLPWHPAEDPTDLNGVYTLRLTVFGRDGQKTEDRTTVEVGRAIAQALPGIAVSPDQRVVMRFPEQSLTYPFRVYTILPLSETGEELPPTPEGGELIGPIYRVREPGDRFTKDVTLEFTANKEELQGRDTVHIGIMQYDTEKKEWLWLATFSSVKVGTGTFSTILTELPTPKAIYALAFDPRNAHRSQPQLKEGPTPAALEPIRPGVLVYDTFEEDMGHWKSRNRLVGAALDRDNQTTPDGSYALKLVNESYGGNFSVTLLDRSFDVREYPWMSFDYRIDPEVKTDFYLLVSGRWYNLSFSDDPTHYRNRGVNIANLGQIEGILADGQWHSASVNLYELLRWKTRHTQVDAIVMADWDVSGYRKLEFGHNARGAAYYIDNFKIATGSTPKISDGLMVDAFDAAKPTNLLGGPSGTFSSPGTDYCQAIVANDAKGGVLKLAFDTSRDSTYCGYWTALMAANVGEMSELSLRVRTSGETPPMLVGLRHAVTGVEAKVPVQPYAGEPDQDGWRAVTIPLSVFRGRGLSDLSLMDALFVTFEHNLPSGESTIFLDDLRFRKEPTFAAVADFDSYPMEYNLLGGGFRTQENGAAAISAGYHEDKADSWPTVTGMVRISYGGTIGLDYGKGNFSYAVWETDLLGFDARQFRHLVLRIRGEKGGERPNIYLDDGTTRHAVRAKEFSSITTSWQEVRIPLERFSLQGVDLSHLEALQLDFEWEEMSGTIYLSRIRFE